MLILIIINYSGWWNQCYFSCVVLDHCCLSILLLCCLCHSFLLSDCLRIIAVLAVDNFSLSSDFFCFKRRENFNWRKVTTDLPHCSLFSESSFVIALLNYFIYFLWKVMTGYCMDHDLDGWILMNSLDFNWWFVKGLLIYYVKHFISHYI